jgi:hypothetical protein
VRTAQQRSELFASGIPAALTAKQFEALRVRIARFGETVMKAQTNAEARPA